ncbi:MAG: hypothetical protein GTO29_14270 [Candidatus Latescibacteria bacterium]|nr:hypothetical protein [Candidatus Latescibacterota bacterium]NIO57312.1 hypothetical protein [Candidatus Latescibacterota bacterium]
MEYVITSHVAAIAISSVVISGAAVAACAVLRRTSASFRHLVLVGMFVSLLTLPVMSFLMPTWKLPVTPAVEFFRTEMPPPAGLEHRGFRRVIPGGAAEQAAALSTTVTDKTPSATSVAWILAARRLLLIAPAIWGIGALIVLILQVVRWAGAGFIAEMATTIENRDLLSIAERVRWEMGIKRRVGLLRSDMAAVSMVWGIRHPCIILPSCAESWSANKLEAVLRHELAHVKRSDNLLQIVAVATYGLYWFNPFVWAATRRFNFEREVACDNIALNTGSAASAYAKHLMDISMSLRGPKSRRIIPAVMAHSSDVKKRLVSVLNPGVNRRSAGIPAVAICISLMLLFSLPFSALRLGPRRVLASGTVAVDAAIRMEGWSFRGSMNGTWPRVVIVHGLLRNKDAYIEIEGRNLILDPETERGFRFNKDKGYMRLTRYAEEAKIEYECRREKKGRKLVTTYHYYLDGEQVEPDEKAERELKRILESAYHWLTDGNS